MRILHIYQDFFPKRGGIEDHILTLCQHTSLNIKPIVLSSSLNRQTKREMIGRILLVRAGSYGRYFTPFCPTMPFEIKLADPDLIHIHLPCPMAAIAVLLSRHKAPLIISYHNDIVKQKHLLKLYKPFLNLVLHRAAHILVGTADYCNSSSILTPYRHKCLIVPYGIDLDRFAATPQVTSIRQKIRHRFPGPITLFVGRLCYYKGLEYLIPAMHDVPGNLIILGVGPLETHLQALVRQHNLQRKVHFVGHVDDTTLAAYYHACNLLVLPSTYRSEAFGLVQLQAQTCNKPVISSNLPGVSTVNVHHKTGIIIQPRSTNAIADAINELLVDKSLRRQLGAAGRKQVEELYNVSQMVEKVENVYKNVLVSAQNNECVNN